MKRLSPNKNIELADNAMLKHRPELFYEWDFEKNDQLGLDVYKVTRGSGKKAYWKCLDCESGYKSIIGTRASGFVGCPYCSGRKVNHTNSLCALRPDIANHWHPTKNGNLTPHDVTLNSNKKVWWWCGVCKSNYDMMINNKTRKNYGCPYCSNQRVNHTNSLSSLNPKLASEWHPTKNGDLTPSDVTYGSGKKVWWMNKECGHEWDANIGDRSIVGSGCPYCTTSNARVLVGFNDMWTTNPELASQLADPEDGYKYLQMSSKKVDWKCSECNSIIRHKKIGDVNNDGLSCSNCSDGYSFAEKIFYNIFILNDIYFQFDVSQVWSEGRRYDFQFSLNNLSYIVEVHGMQHYSENGFDSVGGRTLKEEQENDELKERLAKENGIDKYIVIDCRYSTLEWVKSHIESSELRNVINLSEVDWKEIGRISTKSFVKEVCELWNKGIYRSALHLSKEVGMNSGMVTNYLKRGAEIGWCDYDSTIKKVVIQLDDNTRYIRTFKSLAEAERITGVCARRISESCRNNVRTIIAHKWMYETDYKHMLSIGISHEEYMNTYYPQPSKPNKKEGKAK